jgi:hypothetical protein
MLRAMWCRWQYTALVAALLAACGAEPGDAPVDATATVDGAGRHDSIPRPDAIVADAMSSDVNGSCNSDRTRTVPPDGPIGIGTFCDDLYVCVENRDVAETVALVAPNFSCRPGGPTFDCTGVACTWEAAPQGGGPGSIDDYELDQVCALTLLPNLDSDVYCVVYL